jgi:exodeoxyribonuclease VII small subunit
MAKKPTKLPDFEQNLSELESLVERMERGEISLEESLKNFEKGIALTRVCQKALQDAERKVQILLQENGTDKLVEATDLNPPESP